MKNLKNPLKIVFLKALFSYFKKLGIKNILDFTTVKFCTAVVNYRCNGSTLKIVVRYCDIYDHCSGSAEAVTFLLQWYELEALNLSSVLFI